MTSRSTLTSLALPLFLTAVALSACTVQEGPEPAYAPQPTYAPATTTEVVADQPPPAPPPPAVEVAPPSPGPDYVWIAGAHHWNGRGYDWQRGRYERRPHANARYQPAHWESHGNRHAWVEARWE